MADQVPAKAREFFKSRKSGLHGACVEVCFDGDVVGIRDSKSATGLASLDAMRPVITVSLHTWRLVIVGLVHTELGSFGTLAAEPGDDEAVQLRCLESGTTLLFTAVEWNAFLDGVRAGEFLPQPVPA